MKNPRMSRRLAAVAAVLAVNASGALAGPASSGWLHLQQNHNGEARAAFRTAVKANPSDADALLGLGRVAAREGDDAAAAVAWRAFYKAAPDHSAALALWPDFARRADASGRIALAEAAARDILASAKSPAELKTAARRVLRYAADNAGRTAEADSQIAALGQVRKWRAIGPFDNVSRSGYDKVYEPERRLDLAGTCAGSDNRSLRWHPFAGVDRVGSCWIARSLGEDDDSAYYAVTAVSASADEKVTMRFDATGASKVWLNGVLVLRDPIYRSTPDHTGDMFAVPVSLRKGWNTILVKIADDTETNAQFALRFTALSSETARTYPADPTKASLSAPLVDPGVAPAPVTAAAARMAASAAEDAGSAAILGEYLRDVNDLEGSLRVLRAAVAKSPRDAWLRWQLSQTLEQDGQVDEAREERDAARKADPRLAAAELKYLNDESESATPTEQVKRLKQLLQRNPAFAEARWDLAQAYVEAEMETEAIAAANAAVRAGAGPEKWGDGVFMLQMMGRTADAREMAARGLKLYPGSEVLYAMRTLALQESGKTAEIIAVYEKLQQMDPGDPEYRKKIAELHERRKDFPRAARTLLAARAIRPQDSGLAARLAEVMRLQGKKTEAIALLKEAVLLDPSAVALRDKLQVLSGEKPILDRIPATPVEPILAAAKGPAPAGVSEVVLLDEARQVVYPDCATASRLRYIVRVLDDAAVKKFQMFPFPVSSSTADPTVEVARLIRPDGKIVDASDHAGMGGVAFPSLAVGDIIDVSFRVDDYHDGALARHFWTQWTFSDTGPVKLSRYVLVTPDGMAFQQRRHGNVPEPAVTTLGSWKVHEWKMADLAGQKEEMLGTSRLDHGDWLDISTIASWKDVVAWYQDLARPRCVPDSAVRAKAHELTAKAQSEEEKIQAIVAFVAREIQYQSNPFRMSAYIPTEGKQVLRERYGDCKDKAALLCSLLDTVGIRSRMVLLSGRTDGLIPYLPSPRFNHAIARVDTAKGPLWVDATADRMEYGFVPFEDQGVPALVIDDATADLTTTPASPVEQNLLGNHHAGVLNEEGKLTGSFNLTVTGTMAWMMRSAFQMVPEANRDQVVHMLASEFVKNAQVRNPRLENLGDLTKPVTFRADYENDTFAAAAGDFLMVRLPWDDGAADKLSAISEKERIQDLEVAPLRGQYNSTVRLQIPQGYAPQDLQPEVRKETPWGWYRVTYRLEGNTLDARFESQLTALRVPVKEIAPYVEFLRAMNKETQRQIVLKKG